jgi:hypothetical protein
MRLAQGSHQIVQISQKGTSLDAVSEVIDSEEDRGERRTDGKRPGQLSLVSGIQRGTWNPGVDEMAGVESSGDEIGISLTTRPRSDPERL